jgi:hypothetical protein
LIFAELKVPPNKTTPAQDAWLKALANAYSTVYVLTPADWKKIELILQ